MNEELISVIVPVFRVEQYLDKCLESIVSQTYKNLEIIIVDDGSPDSCPIKCDQWKEKDSRIKVLHKKNGGLSDARNRGIDIATGNYLLFVDSDDYVSSSMIEKLYKLLKKTNAEISICNYFRVEENGTMTKEKINLSCQTYSGHEILTQKIFEEIAWWWSIAWNKLYKKDLFDGLRYKNGKYHEDEFIMHEIFHKCSLVACTEEPLYYYIQRPGSIMSQQTSIKRLDAAEAYFNRALFFEENQYDLLTIEKTIHKGIEEFQKFFYRNPKAYRGECRQKVKLIQKQFQRVCAIDFDSKYRRLFLKNCKSLYWNWKLAANLKKIKSILRH